LLALDCEIKNSELQHLMIGNLGPELARLGIRIGPADEEGQRLITSAVMTLRPSGLLTTPQQHSDTEVNAALVASEFLRRIRNHLQRRRNGS
jgi:hypothetical protein